MENKREREELQRIKKKSSVCRCMNRGGCVWRVMTKKRKGKEEEGREWKEQASQSVEKKERKNK